MPRKVIRANQGKHKRSIIKPIILICIFLVIAAIIAIVLYELGYNKADIVEQTERNETITGSSNTTSNETEIFTIPAEIVELTERNEATTDLSNATSNETEIFSIPDLDKQEIKLDLETEPIQVQPNGTTENPHNTTTETNMGEASVSPVSANGNLSIIQSLQKPANLSVAFATTSEYLKVLGTKWCGPGFTTASDVPLDFFQEAHQCVSEHDDCSEVIRFGHTKHGLMNMDFCKRSHCSCDRQFYKCLKNHHGLTFEIIGVAYFTILGSPCFMEDYPIVQCEKCTYTSLSYKKRNRRRCIKYQFNETQPKKYQWFDNPLYY